MNHTYDILGRRTQKIDYSKSSTNPEKIAYVYTKENLLMEYRTIGVLVNGTGTLTPLTLAKRYINSIGTDAVIGYDAEEQISPTSTGITTTRYQYHKNQLGSIIALTKGPRTLIQKYSYDSYGKAYVYSGTTLIPISTYTGNTYSNTRLYTGREYDKETNLYYLRARYYNSDTGRFLQRDPVGQSDQVNLYTYVRNSPLGYTDRDGRKASAMIHKGISGTMVVATFLGIGAVGLFDNEFYQGDTFLGYSFVGSTELRFFEGSNYVKSFKKSKNYNSLIDEISFKLNTSNELKFKSTYQSSDTMSTLTLGKYNYSVIAEKKDSYYDVNLQITDIYDFNKEKNDGTFLNWYLNTMHDANVYGILTPISVEININQKIKLGN